MPLASAGEQLGDLNMRPPAPACGSDGPSRQFGGDSLRACNTVLLNLLDDRQNVGCELIGSNLVGFGTFPADLRA
jgi:hypothetical protein